MKDLFLNPASQQQLNAIKNELPQTLILSGQKGIGLGTIARDLARSYDRSALVITPDEKGSIKIDTVRQLYRHTGTKSLSHQFVVIDDADALAAPAQNALLKLLEEPPNNTFFVLTSHHTQLLLPTIRSRAQEAVMLPITQTVMSKLLDEKGIKDNIKRSQLLFMASGLPAELLRLIESRDYFDTRSTVIRQAREFMSTNLYERLIIAYKLGSNREAAIDLLGSAMLIIRSSLTQKPRRELVDLLKNLLACEEKLLADGNVRTQLLRFVAG